MLVVCGRWRLVGCRARCYRCNVAVGGRGGDIVVGISRGIETGRGVDLRRRSLVIGGGMPLLRMLLVLIVLEMHKSGGARHSPKENVRRRAEAGERRGGYGAEATLAGNQVYSFPFLDKITDPHTRLFPMPLGLCAKSSGANYMRSV